MNKKIRSGVIYSLWAKYSEPMLYGNIETGKILNTTCNRPWKWGQCQVTYTWLTCKAFDLVNHKMRSEKKIKCYQIAVSLLNRINSYLSGRQQEVHYAYIKLDTTTCCIVKYGVPQGSIIILFFLYYTLMLYHFILSL